MTTEPIDTINEHWVGLQAGKVVITLPPTAPMPHEDALRMAAWIVAIVDDDDRFAAILAAVRST